MDLAGWAISDLIWTGVSSVSSGKLDLLFREGRSFCLEEQQDGRWFQTSVYPIRDGDGKIARIAIQSHDITDWKSMEERMKQEGLSQIDKNMEQFQILNDQIRNPLQVIAGYVALSDNQLRTKIEGQIQIINDLVTQLDKGWVESEKVRSFLIRHYQHGGEYPPGPCEVKEP
jgi:hypothetical protein